MALLIVLWFAHYVFTSRLQFHNSPATTHRSRFQKSAIRNPQSEGSGQRQRQQDGGIEVNPMPPNSDVQVRRGGSAGSATQPNDLTPLHAVAFTHFDFGQVHIERQ